MDADAATHPQPPHNTARLSAPTLQRTLLHSFSGSTAPLFPVAAMPAAMALGAAPSALASRHGDVLGSRVRARVLANAKTSVARGAAPLRVVAKDFPKPEQIDKTKNYLLAKDLSDRIKVTTARRIATSHRGRRHFPPTQTTAGGCRGRGATRKLERREANQGPRFPTRVRAADRACAAYCALTAGERRPTSLSARPPSSRPSHRIPISSTPLVTKKLDISGRGANTRRSSAATRTKGLCAAKARASHA